jgi:hypothetical protein
MYFNGFLCGRCLLTLYGLFNTPLKRPWYDTWVDNTSVDVRDVTPKSFSTKGFCKEIGDVIERLDMLEYDVSFVDIFPNLEEFDGSVL